MQVDREQNRLVLPLVVHCPMSRRPLWHHCGGYRAGGRGTGGRGAGGRGAGGRGAGAGSLA